MLIAIPMSVDDGAPRTAVPAANGVIIALNVALYFLGVQMVVGPGTGIFSIVGYGFSHAGLAHLMVNMWLLMVIGNPVNRRIGDSYYTLCYLGTVAVLGVFAKILANEYLTGSSGAIFAIVAVLAMLMPSVLTNIGYVALFPLTVLIGIFRRPPHWVFWLIRWDTIRLRARTLLFFVPALQLLGVFWWRLNWTNLGHLLGFACGIAFVMLLPDRVSIPGRPRFRFSS